jgi:hypothetical protein
LKKRSKKLLVLRARAASAPQPAVNKSFFASFFAKKEALTYVLAAAGQGPSAGLAGMGLPDDMLQAAGLPGALVHAYSGWSMRAVKEI